MFVASTKSDGKIFHSEQCRYAKRIAEHNRKCFDSAEDARKEDYKICKCCSFVGRLYRKERRVIEKIAKKNDLRIIFYDGAVYVSTKIGLWKIAADNTQNNMILYHGNKQPFRNCFLSNGKILADYHIQKYVRYKSIAALLNYILKHDEWRLYDSNKYKNMPKSTKKQKKAYKKQKERAKKAAVYNVLNIIERMEHYSRVV